MRYHLTAVRMAVKEKTRNNKCWRGYRGKRTLIRCRWVCILVQPLWERVWRFLKKLRIALPYDLAVPLPGTYPENSCAVPPACTAHLTAAPSKAAEAHSVAQCPPAPVVWQARWGLSAKGTRGPRILERGGPGRVPEPGPNLERDSWEAKLWQGAPCVVCNHWCTAP